jgi:hypothetical protein
MRSFSDADLAGLVKGGGEWESGNSVKKRAQSVKG